MSLANELYWRRIATAGVLDAITESGSDLYSLVADRNAGSLSFVQEADGTTVVFEIRVSEVKGNS